MADRSKQNKESTPPPLLLMPASQGLTFSSGQGSNVLLPVPQGEPSLITSDEVGEADSFLGQSPPRHSQLSNLPQATSSSGSFGLFQGPNPTGSDPFSRIQQPHPSQVQPPISGFGGPPVTSVSPPGGFQPPPGPGAPPTGLPPTVSPPSGPAQNYHRLSGRPKYAPPPAGTYAPTSSNQGSPPGSFTDTSSNQGLPPPTHFTSLPNTTAQPPISVSMGIGRPPPQGSPPSMMMGGPPSQGTSSHTVMGGPPPSTLMPGGPPSSSMMSGSGLAGPPPSTVDFTSDIGGSGPSPLGGPPQHPGGSFGIQGLYVPIQYHWFYCQSVKLRQVWKPFSIADSIKLEEAHKTGAQENLIVSTDGGRYDVDIHERTRTAVYWDDPPSQVRRASWFYRPEGDTKFVPYEEDFAEKLEDVYEKTLGNHDWHRRHEFPNGDVIVMHNPNVVVSFRASAQPDEWGTTQGDMRPRVVKRGVEDFDEITDGEPTKIDHVVFVVHGIGPTCDLRFRNIIECVDDFRNMSLQIGKTHFGQYQDEGRIGRVEFLPVRWHNALHGDATGVDRHLKSITLNSISKLRNFTNDTLLDILFYASPTYAQQIADTVGTELNRLHHLFLSRNAGFQGGVSVVGHSLGSLILFDLLVHQHDPNSSGLDPADSTSTIIQGGAPSRDSISPQVTRDSTPSTELTGEGDDSDDSIDTLEGMLAALSLSDYTDTFRKEEMDLETLAICEESDIKEMGIPLGPRKKIQSYLKKYRQRKAKKKDAARQASEVQARLESSPQTVSATSTPSTHDPLLRSASNTSVHYMMGVAGTGVPFVQYPQLRFQPTQFFALGSPIAMFLTVRGVENLGDEFKLPTCHGFFNIFHPAYRIEPLLTTAYPPKPFLMPHHKGRKRLHLELRESITRVGADLKQKMIHYFKNTWRTINDFALAHKNSPQALLDQEVDSVMSEMSSAEEEALETESMMSSVQEEDVYIGSLNQGRRVDYVLQEKPIESFNDYLFALGSHSSYWESEDTILMILKEVYGQKGLAPIKPGQEHLRSPQGSGLPPPAGATAFPRHPMAPHPGATAAQMVAPPGGPFGRPQMPPGGNFGSQQGGSFASQSSGFAPPPLSGFVRKT